ncbi:MAG: hypothetical protein ACRCUS_08200 [Anaerovoracaceae bacterium]
MREDLECGFVKRGRDRDNRRVKSVSRAELFFNENYERWELIKVLDWLVEPHKVKAIMEMEEEEFQEYKYALKEFRAIQEIKRG